MTEMDNLILVLVILSIPLSFIVMCFYESRFRFALQAFLACIPVYWISSPIHPIIDSAIFIYTGIIGGFLASLSPDRSAGLSCGFLVSAIILAFIPIYILSCLIAKIIVILAFSLIGFFLAFKYPKGSQIIGTSILSTFLLFSFCEAFLRRDFLGIGFRVLLMNYDRKIRLNAVAMVFLSTFLLLSFCAIPIQYKGYRKSEKVRQIEEQKFQHRRDKFQKLILQRMRSLDYHEFKYKDAIRSDYNYFEFSSTSSELREIYYEISPMFSELGSQFGFQSDNILNQKEHALCIIHNHVSRDPVEGIKDIHDKLFRNYINWCKFLEVTPLCSSDNQDNRALQLLEISLFLLVWGEAANIRHIPECLCFIIHSLLKDLIEHKNLNRPEGTFLNFIIRPIYDHLHEAFKLGKNYDDVNEFFWTTNCLKFSFCLPNLHSECSKMEDHVIEGLYSAPKTFTEKRNLFRIILVYWRIFSFLTQAYFFLIVIGLLIFLKVPLSKTRGIFVLSSWFVLLSTLSVIKEMLVIWSNGKCWTALPRLLLKALINLNLLLLYVHSYKKSTSVVGIYLTFWIFSLIYMTFFVIQVLFEILPSVSSKIENWILSYSFLSEIVKWWNPNLNSYVGHNMSDTFLHTLKYQIFWVLILITKFVFSYFFQIQPLFYPSVELYSRVEFDILGFSYSRILILISLWLPFVLIFYLDIMIWFTVWEAFVGIYVGIVREKLGTIRSYSAMKDHFLEIVDQFAGKILGEYNRRSDLRDQVSSFISRNNLDSIDETQPLLNISTPKTFSSAADPIKFQQQNISDSPCLETFLSRFQSKSWQMFSINWNEIIQDLRSRDLISNSEVDMLIFQELDLGGAHHLHIPPFLQAGFFDKFSKICRVLGEHYNNTKNNHRRKCKIQKAFVEDIRKDLLLSEGLFESWKLISWFLESLLGERHQESFTRLKSLTLSYIISGKALEVFKIENIEKMKPVLLDLLRLLRVSMKINIDFSRDKNRIYKNNKETAPKLRSNLSFASLNILEKISSGSQRRAPSRELLLIRKHLQNILTVFFSLIRNSTDEAIKITRSILSDQNGFFWEDEYTKKTFEQTISHPLCEFCVKDLELLLNLAAFDAKPMHPEASRRLLFFANSMLQDFPSSPLISQMFSFSTLTPYYEEDVIYSMAELENESPDGVSPLMFLKTVHEAEWINLLERFDLPKYIEMDAALSDPNFSMEVRLWASRLGQTLFRTVSGIMLYKYAIKVLCSLEQPNFSEEEILELINLKFSYILSCQKYSDQKRTVDHKSKDIDYLLERLPHLRVAYIDTCKVGSFDENKEPIVVDEFYSVLIKSGKSKSGFHSDSGIQEVFRIKLPGNPVIGEGKPENQNHAIIFTRGELLQAIDMNQDNYFEESLKMRNLLEYFSKKEKLSGSRPTTIFGFKEHIFSGRLSSIANYMALQENTFASLGQRVLNDPIRLRLHYGHPDVFDKFFFISRGGISKASKGVNLSEDVFAGYNNILRGGHASMREFIAVGKGRDVGLQQLLKFDAKLSQGSAEQSSSRDLYRLGHGLDLFRLFGLFVGGPGFYVCNSLVIWSIFIYTYTKLFWCLLSAEYEEVVPAFSSLRYWFGQIGFLMTLPLLGSLGVDYGFLNAIMEVIRMILTGGPFYFMFSMATKWYYFGQTLLVGESHYRPTGRGFVTEHECFAELFRFYFNSHFSPSFDLMIVLILYGLNKRAEYVVYTEETWPIWLLACSWWITPFWFNPMAFDWDKTILDIKDWIGWMRRYHGDGNLSWETWWTNENRTYSKMPLYKRVYCSFWKLRFFLIAFGLLYANDNYKFYERVVFSWVLIFIMLIIWFTIKADFSTLCSRTQLLATQICLLSILFISLSIWIAYFNPQGSKLLSSQLLQTLTGLVFVIGGIVSIFLSFGFQWWSIREIYMIYHYFVGVILLVPITLLSAIYIPSLIQTRILFHNAFSRGVIIDDLIRRPKGVSRKSQATSTDQGPILRLT